MNEDKKKYHIYTVLGIAALIVILVFADYNGLTLLEGVSAAGISLTTVMYLAVSIKEAIQNERRQRI